MARRLKYFLFAVFACWSTSGALSQTFRVTAGEHPNFTRVVVHTPPGTQWSIDTAAREHHITVSPSTALFDLSRIFERIPRTRVSSASTSPGQLHLSSSCDCEILAWEERPGLIVIDFGDADQTEPLVAELEPASDPAPMADTRQPTETARVAGTALAESHALEQQRQSDEAPILETSVSTAGLTRTLGLPVAQALSQGLLEPSAQSHEGSQVLLMPDTGLPADLPENMRVSTVIDRPNPDAPPSEVAQNTCQGAEALDFLLTANTEGFGAAFGRLTQTLYGEFDQPNPDARRELVELYLAAGFGAEARVLISNQPDPVVGREFILGMSDILEERSSNSRMRLVQLISCGGPASLLAALAGAPHSEILNAAPEIALSFTELDGSLRTILGPKLAEALIDAGAVDAARVVAGSAHRSPWTEPGALDVVDAMLDRARGHVPDSAARLEHAQGADAASVLARLALAIESGRTVSEDALANAESLASTERRSEIGPDIMAAVIQLYMRAGSYANAFSALDRLVAWGPRSAHDINRIDDFRDQLWASIARDANDLTLTRGILGRDDWRDPELSLATRQAVSQRLLDLGLGEPVRNLLAEAHDAVSATMLGEAHLILNQPDQAMEAVLNIETDGARRTRARALAALGQNESAAQEFEALEDPQNAQHSAVLARDWDRVHRMATSTSTQENNVVEQVGQVMGYPPGHLELAMRSGGNPTEASSNSRDISAANDTGTGPQDPPTTPLESVAQSPLAQQDGLDAPGPTAQTRDAESAPSNALLSADTQGEQTLPQSFDRLGLITRSATLLDESARLREIFAPLLETPSPITR